MQANNGTPPYQDHCGSWVAMAKLARKQLNKGEPSIF